MANIGIVSQSPQETTVSLPAGRTFFRFKNVDPTNNHTVELVPLDANSQIVPRLNDTNDWTKTDDGFGISLLRNLAAGNTSRQVEIDYQVTLNMTTTNPMTVLDKRRNIVIGAVDMSTYTGAVSGQLTEVARQLQVILTNAGFVNSVTVNSKQGISININNTKTIDKVIEIYSNVTDNSSTVINLTAVDNGVVNSIERKPSSNPYGNHAITFAISATPRVAPTISTDNATDSTTGITISDTDVFDIYVDNLDVPKYANLTKTALLQMFSKTSDEDIEIFEQARTITCVGALPYAQGIDIQTQADGIVNFSNIINGSTATIQLRENYMFRLNAIQNLTQPPNMVFTISPDQTDRALIGLTQSQSQAQQASPLSMVITSIDGNTLSKPITLNVFSISTYGSSTAQQVPNGLNIGSYKTLLAQLNINIKMLYIDDVCALAVYNLDPSNPRTIAGYCIANSNPCYLDASGTTSPLQSNIANQFYNNDFRLSNSTTTTSYDTNKNVLNFTTTLQPAQGSSDWSGNISKNGTSTGSVQYFVEMTVIGTEALSRSILNDQVSLGNTSGITTPVVIVGDSIYTLASNINAFLTTLQTNVTNSKNNTMQYSLGLPTVTGAADYTSQYTDRDVYNLDGTLNYKFNASDKGSNGYVYNTNIAMNYLTIAGDSEAAETINAVNVNVPGVRILFNNVDKSRSINNSTYYNFFYADQNDYPPQGNYTDSLAYPIKRNGVYLTCNVLNLNNSNSGYNAQTESPTNANMAMVDYYRVTTSPTAGS